MTSRDYAWLLPGAAAALGIGILVGRGGQQWLLFLPMLLFAVGAACLLLKPGRLWAAEAVVMVVGCLLGYGAYHPSLPPEGEYHVTGIVAQEISQREDGHVATLLRNVTLNGQPLGRGAYWSFYLAEGELLPEGLTPGCRVTLQTKVYHPGDANNPGGFNFREYLLQKGCTIGLYGSEELQAEPSSHWQGLAARLRHYLTLRLKEVMGETAGSYAATMLLGSQHLIPDGDREAFNRLGIAHILSVSGFHVGVLAGLLNWVLQRMYLSQRQRFGCIMAVLAAYTVLTGMNAPVVRAVILYGLYGFGAVKHRQRSSLHLLCGSFVIQLLVSPVQLTGLSFQLTYGAMLGLTLVTPRLRSLRKSWRFSKVWSGLCASLGAQAGILLPELYWFEELPLLGIGVNTLVMTAASFLLLLCWLTLFLLPVPVLGHVLGSLTACLLEGLVRVVRFMGSQPGMTLWTCRSNLLTALGWGCMILTLSWWWRWKHRRLCLVLSVVLLSASVVPWPNQGSRYLQFSVGEADAALMQDAGCAVAIDTGLDGKALADYLHQKRLCLDGLVLTHLHVDHAGGIDALLEQGIAVKTCYLPWGGTDALVDESVKDALLRLQQSGTRLITVSRGDVIPLPHGSLTVLWPEKGKVRPAQDANLSSMVLLANIRGNTLLLTGDVSFPYELYAAAPADVLKVAHHGSATSTSAAFLQQAAPQMLLLSCGTEERVQGMALRSQGIPMVDTFHSGCVTIEFETDGMTVKTLR